MVYCLFDMGYPESRHFLLYATRNSKIITVNYVPKT